MKYAYDIHIHSVLSPCSDELMTPNNILNMGYLNELDIIAVTDHNSMKQLETIFEISESYDFIVVPGVEIQVEGGHLLAYFDLESYKKFDNELETFIKQEVSEEEQVLMDVFDQEVKNYEYALSGDVNASLDEILQLIHKYNGASVLAHINKDSYSLKNRVKEEHLQYIHGMEVTKYVELESFLDEYPILKGLPIYRSSDSHTITDLSRRTNYIEMKELSITAFLEALKNE